MEHVYCNNCGKEIKEVNKEENHTKITALILALAPVIFFVLFSVMSSNAYLSMFSDKIGLKLIYAGVVSYGIAILFLHRIVYVSKVSEEAKSIYLLLPALLLLITTLIIIVGPTLVEFIKVMTLV